MIATVIKKTSILNRRMVLGGSKRGTIMPIAMRYVHDEKKKAESSKAPAPPSGEREGGTAEELSKMSNENGDDIHPDWLAMERRVKGHRPKPKG